MTIDFEDSGITEYAGLKYFNGNENVLEGDLYYSNMTLREENGMSLNIGDDGNTCNVS